MIDRTLARGLFLAAVALLFGLNSFRYGLGSFNHAGAGLFPLMISVLLLVVGLVTIGRSFFDKGEPLEMSYRNIGLLVASLCVFALVTHFINMLLGIVAMVLTSSLASRERSLQRSLIVSVCLVGVAFAFKHFLGLNLPLI